MKHDLADNYSVAKWLKEKKELNPSSRFISVALIMLGTVLTLIGIMEMNSYEVTQMLKERDTLALVHGIRDSEIITEGIRNNADRVERLYTNPYLDTSLEKAIYLLLVGIAALVLGKMKLKAEPVDADNPCNAPGNSKTQLDD